MKRILWCLALLVFHPVKANSNIEFVKSKLQAKPILLARVTKKASFVKKDGKNYLHTIFDNKGNKKIVKTMGKEFVYNKLAISLRNFPLRKNQFNLYKLLYSKLPKKYLRGKQTPKSLRRKSNKIITKAISRLTRDLLKISKSIKADIESKEKIPENLCGPHPDGILKNLNISQNQFDQKFETQIWNFFNPDFSISIAKLLSILKQPMILALPVNPSMDKASINGYAQYLGSREGNRGGHSVLVVAIVENKDLPITAPKGPGGGYFVAKNSWGNCWKDAGYIYLPMAWVKKYAYSLTTISSI